MLNIDCSGSLDDSSGLAGATRTTLQQAQSSAMPASKGMLGLSRALT